MSDNKSDVREIFFKNGSKIKTSNNFKNREKRWRKKQRRKSKK